MKGNPCESYDGHIDMDYEDDVSDDDETLPGQESSLPNNYRDYVSEAISGLLILDGVKTFRGLKPQSFLMGSAENVVTAEPRIPTPYAQRSNKQESKHELPHRDIVNEAFANARTEATTTEREHFERQMKAMEADFNRALKREKETYELEYQQRIKRRLWRHAQKHKRN